MKRRTDLFGHFLESSVGPRQNPTLTKFQRNLWRCIQTTCSVNRTQVRPN